MKAVLISIQPKWCEKIASGEKTIEVRKSRPKSEMPFKCYIYCTKGKDLLREVPCWHPKGKIHTTNYKIINEDYNTNKIANGKVIGEFVCDDIDTVHVFNDILYCVKNSQANKLGQMCLTIEEVKAYLGEKDGYDWHISDLKIYDKPKELSEFRKYYECGNNSCGSCDKCDKDYHLTRPPQSYMFVEELKE